MDQAPAEIYTEYIGLTASALLPLQLHQTFACRDQNPAANEAEPAGYAHSLSQEDAQCWSSLGLWQQLRESMLMIPDWASRWSDTLELGPAGDC